MIPHSAFRISHFIIPLSLLLPASLFGDWVALADGSRLQGIDFKQKGEGFIFTVETGKTIYIPKANFISHEKSPPGETVRFRDKDVKLEEMVRTLARELKAKLSSQDRALEQWAKGGKAAGESRAEVIALAPDEQEACYARALSKGSSDAARKLAAKQIAAFRTPGAASALAASMVADPSQSVRKESVQAFESLEVPGKGESFIPFLMSAKSDQRIRASEALRSFPTYRAVPPLVLAVHKSWNGGQRSFFFQGEQRAYIADYELVSGGTGFSIVEVADPVIRTTTTGVVLDAEVSHSEEHFHLATLEKITHRSFGSDLARWQEWWKGTGEALAIAEHLPTRAAATEGERKPEDADRKPAHGPRDEPR
jgi:hypothetical protein